MESRQENRCVGDASVGGVLVGVLVGVLGGVLGGVDGCVLGGVRRI